MQKLALKFYILLKLPVLSEVEIIFYIIKVGAFERMWWDDIDRSLINEYLSTSWKHGLLVKAKREPYFPFSMRGRKCARCVIFNIKPFIECLWKTSSRKRRRAFQRRYSLTTIDIASMCSTSREMMNRMLNDLKKTKIITFEKGYIIVLDLNY